MMTTEKVTVTLPTDLMTAVRTMAPPRRQSQFIAEAIREYIAEQERRILRERLIAGYQANADADALLASKGKNIEWENIEWENIEAEGWPDDLVIEGKMD